MQYSRILTNHESGPPIVPLPPTTSSSSHYRHHHQPAIKVTTIQSQHGNNNGKENSSERNNNNVTTAAPPPPPSPRYAHPHSPNPSHVSQFISPSSPRPASVTTSTVSAPVSYASRIHHDAPAYVAVLAAASSSSASSSTVPPTPAHYSRPMPATNNQTRSHYGHSSEPSVVQLLAEQPNDRGGYVSKFNQNERDSTMANAPGVVSWRKGQGFKAWEKVRLESTEVRRKADVAQLCLFSFSLRNSCLCRMELTGVA